MPLSPDLTSDEPLGIAFIFGSGPFLALLGVHGHSQCLEVAKPVRTKAGLSLTWTAVNSRPRRSHSSCCKACIIRHGSPVPPFTFRTPTVASSSVSERLIDDTLWNTGHTVCGSSSPTSELNYAPPGHVTSRIAATNNPRVVLPHMPTPKASGLCSHGLN